MIKPGRVKPNKMKTLFHRQKKFKSLTIDYIKKERCQEIYYNIYAIFFPCI